jgi:hypothetical protein
MYANQPFFILGTACTVGDQHALLAQSLTLSAAVEQVLLALSPSLNHSSPASQPTEPMEDLWLL